MPSKMALWAWERPERMDFLPDQTPVAYLAETIYLRGERLVIRSRRQGLTVSPNTPLTAVIRLETSQAEPPVLSTRQSLQLVSQIDAFAQQHPGQGIQIDFDARLSERAFYRSMLKQLHTSLPQSTRLSMTALASWCMDDDWIQELPVAEAIPMVFRMGIDSPKVIQYLASGHDFKDRLCRQSIGLSVDEPIRQTLFKSVLAHRILMGRTIYWFNPHPWTKAIWQQVKQEFVNAG